MKISELMSRAPRACRETDTLDRAAQLMWEHDCGFIPVVNEKGSLVGTITDRDICMGAWTQGRPLSQVQASWISRHPVFTVNENDSVEAAELLMLRKQIRRLPVLDPEGKLVGVLSLGDLARRLEVMTSPKGSGISRESVAQTLAGISRARASLQQPAGSSTAAPPPGASPPIRRKPVAHS
jgi:CBS domain-containing protein